MLLSLLKSAVVSNLPKSYLSISLFNLSTPNPSTFDFKSAKSHFLANCDVSTPDAFLKSDFVALLEKFHSTFTSFLHDHKVENNSFLYNNKFFINPAII